MSSESSAEENVKVKQSKSAKTKSKDKKDKKHKKTEKSDSSTLEDDVPVKKSKKSKKDKGKDMPRGTGADVEAQNITISAEQFQEMMEMIK